MPAASQLVPVQALPRGRIVVPSVYSRTRSWMPNMLMSHASKCLKHLPTRQTALRSFMKGCPAPVSQARAVQTQERGRGNGKAGGGHSLEQRPSLVPKNDGPHAYFAGAARSWSSRGQRKPRRFEWEDRERVWTHGADWVATLMFDSLETAVFLL